MTTIAEANRYRMCLDCGVSGARMYRTTNGENPGRLIRVCDRCRIGHDWDRFGLVQREPVREEAEYESA